MIFVLDSKLHGRGVDGGRGGKGRGSERKGVGVR